MMVRPHLRDLPEAPLPAGLEIRPVAEAQLRMIWEADVEAFRDHRFEREQTEADWEIFRCTVGDTSLWRVAWDAEGIAGQVRTYVVDEESERLGRRRAWTESISTRRDWRGRGVASAVIVSSLRQLAGLGYDEAALGVDLDNPTGALGVYERLGYSVVKRYSAYHRPIT
jgi:ribosomal protein S18 acetylase RimI-like enzyme